jgi:hypothetical protein
MFSMNSHTGQSPSTKSCFWPVRSGFVANPVWGSVCMSDDVNHNSSVVGLDVPAGFVHLITGGRWRQS